MAERRTRGIDLLSPPMLVLASMGLAIVSVLIPPDFYQQTVHEPNLMYLNLPLLGFYAAMCATFYVGYRISTTVRPIRLRLGLRGRVRISAFMYLLVPITIAGALVLYTTHALLAKFPDAVALALAGQAQTTKAELAAVNGIKGSLSGAIPFAMAIFWWALWLWSASRDVLSKRKRRVILLGTLSIGALLVFYAFIIAARNILLPTLFGAAIVYFRHGRPANSTRKQLVQVVLLPIAMLLLFDLFSVLRGYTGGKMTEMLVGYVPTSFNHLAALLSGKLDYSFRGIAYSNFDFLLHPPLVERFMRPGEVFGLGHVPLNSQFADATNAAGLNGTFVWVTAFGFIYAQLGLFTPAYVFAWGFLAGRIWTAFIGSRMLGIVLYPWTAFSIIFFFGANYFFSSYLSALFVAFAMLWMYAQLVTIRMDKPRATA